MDCPGSWKQGSRGCSGAKVDLSVAVGRGGSATGLVEDQGQEQERVGAGRG